MARLSFPADSEQLSKVNDLIAQVHRDDLSTNLTLLRAHDGPEFAEKQASFWKAFISNRQDRLLKYGAAHPEISLYAAGIPANGHVYDTCIRYLPCSPNRA